MLESSLSRRPGGGFDSCYKVQDKRSRGMEWTAGKYVSFIESDAWWMMRNKKYKLHIVFNDTL